MQYLSGYHYCEQVSNPVSAITTFRQQLLLTIQQLSAVKLQLEESVPGCVNGTSFRGKSVCQFAVQFVLRAAVCITSNVPTIKLFIKDAPNWVLFTATRLVISLQTSSIKCISW
jgi:hypothetical protein